MPIRNHVTAIFFSLLMLALFSTPSYAIPAFSRQYGTSCSTCHVDFPKLNDFGILEGLAEIVELWEVNVAGAAGSPILP